MIFVVNFSYMVLKSHVSFNKEILHQKVLQKWL